MNVYYQITTDEIFTYDYSQICGAAYGIGLGGLRTPIVFKEDIQIAIKQGYVIKLGKL